MSGTGLYVVTIGDKVVIGNLLDDKNEGLSVGGLKHHDGDVCFANNDRNCLCYAIDIFPPSNVTPGNKVNNLN